MPEAASTAPVPTDGHGVARRAARLPPPVRSSFPRRCDCVWLQMMLRRSGRGRSDGGAGGPLPPPPQALVLSPASRLRSVTAVAEEKWQRLHRWRCGRTVVLGVAAWVAPRPPPLRACSFPGAVIALGRYAEAVFIARTPTDGIGVAGRADPCSPPPSRPMRARRFPGVAIAFGRGCQ